MHTLCIALAHAYTVHRFGSSAAAGPGLHGSEREPTGQLHGHVRTRGTPLLHGNGSIACIQWPGRSAARTIKPIVDTVRDTGYAASARRDVVCAGGRNNACRRMQNKHRYTRIRTHVVGTGEPTAQ